MWEKEKKQWLIVGGETEIKDLHCLNGFYINMIGSHLSYVMSWKLTILHAWDLLQLTKIVKVISKRKDTPIKTV